MLQAPELPPAVHCRGVPTEFFFRDYAGRLPVPEAQLRRLCLGDPATGVPACPGLRPCRAFADASTECGWWAGRYYPDRRLAAGRARRRRRAAA